MPGEAVSIQPVSFRSEPYRRITDYVANLFNSPLNSAISILVLAFLVWTVPPLVKWAFVDAVWTKENAELCRQPGAGACWAVIEARYRLILFGVYPADQHWRAALASLAIIASGAMSCIPAFWTVTRIVAVWVAGFVIYLALMFGGFGGLPHVSTTNWGGLALTLFVFASVILLGMPLSLLLAMARRSDMPVISIIAGAAIDVTRCFPLLTILFSAAVILPVALPDWLAGDKLYRVIAAFAFFFACYQAEIWRGGYQIIDKGQSEAASALGLGYWQREFLVLLPQVFRRMLPPTVNQFVITFKDTSLVSIVGFFDILASTNAAVGTGEWTGYYVEAYIFAGLIYFVFVFTLSQYGAFLERRRSF